VNFGYLQQISNLTLRTFSFWIYKTAEPVGTSDNIFAPFSDEAGILISLTTDRKIQFYSKNYGLGIWQTPVNSVPLNAWVHVVITMDVSVNTNDPSIVINGSTQTLTETSTPSGSRVSEFGVNLVIGNWKTATQDYSRSFAGKIKDVRVYNSILQASDILALYNSGTHDPDLVLNSDLVFQAFVVKTEQLADYVDATLSSDMKVRDAFLGTVGTPVGSPIGRAS
jgi:hypothetical protein